ncbi:hypothetical protein BX616_001269 [Lobosporangium transversale]|uniref:SANTA domain-containing protein n=1 Tax=Lobosporangium transversale TaxID=64571 RepID=A0A1Y2GVU2_9FUNG|nr:hypothetical protein BCR41DRAFT_384966 [Lobosporangium transversale]KAF9904532.1 hypothetical protein BX616_001269 [Lobosporangium transversale]ORZ23895.1 hypothetical protein BCR41DRAFT_384966 [Lobosporangium transversale]|eukprot:XP_021883709.1 hypothetical protein BCR41DRAFT_384966 [Lobosporangium transversale]
MLDSEDNDDARQRLRSTSMPSVRLNSSDVGSERDEYHQQGLNLLETSTSSLIPQWELLQTQDEPPMVRRHTVISFPTIGQTQTMDNNKEKHYDSVSSVMNAQQSNQPNNQDNPPSPAEEFYTLKYPEHAWGQKMHKRLHQLKPKHIISSLIGLKQGHLARRTAHTQYKGDLASSRESSVSRTSTRIPARTRVRPPSRARSRASSQDSDYIPSGTSTTSSRVSAGSRSGATRMIRSKLHEQQRELGKDNLHGSKFDEIQSVAGSTISIHLPTKQQLKRRRESPHNRGEKAQEGSPPNVHVAKMSSSKYAARRGFGTVFRRFECVLIPVWDKHQGKPLARDTKSKASAQLHKSPPLQPQTHFHIQLPQIEGPQPLSHIQSSQIKAPELYNWWLEVKPLQEQINGCYKWIILRGQLPEKDIMAWRTSFIIEALKPTLVATISKSYYRLKGSIDVDGMVRNGFPGNIVDAFKEGFPPDWQTILCSHFNTELNTRVSAESDQHQIREPQQSAMIMTSPTEVLKKLESDSRHRRGEPHLHRRRKEVVEAVVIPQVQSLHRRPQSQASPGSVNLQSKGYNPGPSLKTFSTDEALITTLGFDTNQQTMDDVSPFDSQQKLISQKDSNDASNSIVNSLKVNRPILNENKSGQENNLSLTSIKSQKPILPTSSPSKPLFKSLSSISASSQSSLQRLSMDESLDADLGSDNYDAFSNDMATGRSAVPSLSIFGSNSKSHSLLQRNNSNLDNYNSPFSSQIILLEDETSNRSEVLESATEMDITTKAMDPSSEMIDLTQETEEEEMESGRVQLAPAGMNDKRAVSEVDMDLSKNDQATEVLGEHLRNKTNSPKAIASTTSDVAQTLQERIAKDTAVDNEVATTSSVRKEWPRISFGPRFASVRDIQAKARIKRSSQSGFSPLPRHSHSNIE